jgi:hypothetical protein
MGNRIHAFEATVLDHYGLDLAYGWPRLWLLLPDPVRAEFSDAEDTFVRACSQAGWALPYLVLGVVRWWPACLAAAVLAFVGWRRARGGVEVVATLGESAVDLYGRALAVQLGLGPAGTGPLSPEDGEAVTRILRKGR